jgi:malate synthase
MSVAIEVTPVAGGFKANSAPAGFDLGRDHPQGFAEFYQPLHREFAPRQQELIARRRAVLAASHRGQLPGHLTASEATESVWRVELPKWISDQRNQMTGPADDAELCVKMLNSGAPGVMLDLEDSMANEWEHLQLGIKNVFEALRGTLTYFVKKRNAVIGIKPSGTIIFTRARGLHISQGSVIPGELTPASLYDVARVAYSVEVSELKHPLTFYIPKSESAEEALWWRDVFQAIAKAKGWPHDYIKCMALVEAHPMAYQMEEFIYNLREHLVGLNLGRWDYMASLIHFNLEDPNWVLPDRNTIPFDVPFFQRLRELLPELCHKRGIFAIGGMTALFPSREDAELNARALAVLAKDKKNEADCLMDGAWTGHPDQNQIAIDQFPHPNQLAARRPNADRYPDLRPAPVGVGEHTLTGTRAAIRTVVRYRNGVLNGKGASLLDGYMEDLATDRIYRLMIAQRMRHADDIAVVDESGRPHKHTPELVSRLFDEELEKLLKALPKDSPAQTAERLKEARRIGESMILNQEFDPF